MAKRRVKRRLKKRFMVMLIVSIVALLYIFTSVVKGVSKASMGSSSQTSVLNTDNNTDDNKTQANNADKKKTFNGKPVIVIDAAFGGEYAGSKGVDNILQKDVNLDIALKVEKVLKRYNDVEVFLTRRDDTTVSYEQRINLIKNKKANIVISIQQNTEGSGSAEGIETYVLSKETYKNADSSLGYSVQKAMGMYSTAKDRGVMARNIDILKDSYSSGTVGAVVYTGFITNKKESANLISDNYTTKLAEGIAQGILSYVDNKLLEQ